MGLIDGRSYAIEGMALHAYGPVYIISGWLSLCRHHHPLSAPNHASVRRFRLLSEIRQEQADLIGKESVTL